MWDGFLGAADVLRSDWGGFKPGALDDEHSQPLVLICWSQNDDATPPAWAAYLIENYRHAQSMELKGGHIDSLYHMDEIWGKFLQF